MLVPARRALPVLMVLAAMTSVQSGAAVSVRLFPALGVVGTTWLRLLVAVSLLLATARPGRPWRGHRAAVGLGLVMAGHMAAFAFAIARIPLGTGVAIEFCGPLCVAVLGSQAGRVQRLGWPLLALAGVTVITQPWNVGVTGTARTWLGLAAAALAALGWAAYILLTQAVGRRSEGLGGLAVALATATAVLTPVGALQAWPQLHRAAHGAQPALLDLAACAGAALLVPLAAYGLEMTALRRLERTVFGVWMALEPAIGALIGTAFLGQRTTAWQVPGFAMVVLAGVGTQLSTGALAAAGADPGLPGTEPAGTGPAGTEPAATEPAADALGAPVSGRRPEAP